MASETTSGYDSDLESIDSSELPYFGVEHRENATTHTQPSEVGIASLLDDECAEKRTNERMEEIAKEMQLFSLEECEGTKISFVDVQEKYTELQPPGMQFFTSHHYHIYSQDKLVWPFHSGTTTRNKYLFVDLSPADIKKHLLEGYFERQYTSSKQCKLMVQYLFHLMCCTTETSLMQSAYYTLSNILDANSVNINILGDLLLALANLGGDITKLGKNVSDLSSPVIRLPSKPESELEKPRGMFKENKILILKFLNMHLAKKNKYSRSDLDDLIKAVLAVALDPLLLDSGISIHVSSAINQILNHYPSSENFCENVFALVEHITVYCDFNHHTVAYLCSNYMMPTQKQGKILRSSPAYLQAEISLQREKKDILEFVEVDDVLDLVLEQLVVFSQEMDSNLLLSVLTLLDFCIGDEPLQADERTQLQELCSILEPVIKRRKVDIDDQNALHLTHFTDRLMIKWKQKADHVKRQQTLMEFTSSYSSGSQTNSSSELQANYSSGSQTNSLSGLQCIQSNYS